MSDSEFKILMVVVTGIPALTAAFLTFIGMIMNLRTRDKIQDLHVIVNSRMDQLLRTVAAVNLAEGIKQGEQGKTKDNQS